MKVMKLDVEGSNNDVEKIIQSYVDDLEAFDKYKNKYKSVMKELMKVKEEKLLFFKYVKDKNGWFFEYYCKRCSEYFVCECLSSACHKVHTWECGLIYEM